MGWNAGYTIFEATVIGAYDLGKLDKKLLSVLMEPYRNADIDSGGERDLKTKDGKDVKQVVIETWGLDMPTKPAPDTENEYAADDYYEAVWEAFYKVTSAFGWR